MEGASGSFAVPPTDPFDKSRVLENVKPLRYLVPVFPDASQAPPFVCMPPFGSPPPGYTPFYPFSGQASHPAPDPNQPNFNPAPAPAPAPSRSFRSPVPHFAESDAWAGSSGDTPRNTYNFNPAPAPTPIHSFTSRMPHFADARAGSSRDTPRNTVSGGPGSSSTKKKLENQVGVIDGRKGLSMDIIQQQQGDGNSEVVKNVLMRYDAIRRRLSQLDDGKVANMKAANTLTSKGVRTNTTKRIGAVPGVEIGDIFFFRMELSLVGLHAPPMGGIDYMTVKGESGEEPVAVSIVSAFGQYDDEAEDANVLVYTGQGGNVCNKDKRPADQKLEKGNLALERSWHRGNEVRVIRGVSDVNNPKSKIYVYDGLYKVVDFRVEKGKSGCNVFKYKLERMPGQPAVFSVWKSIQEWKKDFSLRDGVIRADLTQGAESLPVSLVNEVDDEEGPGNFTYFPTVKYSKPLNLERPSSGCNCLSACLPRNGNCSCFRDNEYNFPYTDSGTLVSRKSIIYECGRSCPCGSNCKNRLSQNGFKVRLEVFKTRNKGWGLRSWDPIRAGTFICEYAGEVIDEIQVGQDEEYGDNYEYVFDTNRKFESFKWNQLVEDGASAPSEEEDFNIPSLIISAKKIGNVSRFMNHSCSPNVFWQPITYEPNILHIALFAINHIAPMTELTYDYGIVQAEGNCALNGMRECLCGSPQCRGFFYG